MVSGISVPTTSSATRLARTNVRRPRFSSRAKAGVRWHKLVQKTAWLPRVSTRARNTWNANMAWCSTTLLSASIFMNMVKSALTQRATRRMPVSSVTTILGSLSVRRWQAEVTTPGTTTLKFCQVMWKRNIRHCIR